MKITTENGEEPICDYVDAPDDCMGHSITNATKVPSRLEILQNGETIYDSGEYVKKESGLTIKIRGNTSAYLQKKSYKLKLQKKADLLCREDKKYRDKDWVLLNTGSKLNSKVGFWLSELLEQEWTPSHKVVNLFINDIYRGVYILAEPVSVNNDCRIKLNEEAGYVIEYDAYWWNEDWYFPSKILRQDMKYTYKFPDSDDVTEELNDQIAKSVWEIEDSIVNDEYSNCIDTNSFAKWILGWDILGGIDGAGSNIFVVKPDMDTKLQMGPMWDFDNAFQIDEGWTGTHNGIFYFNIMFNSFDKAFTYDYNKLWHTKGMEIINKLIKRIDEFEVSEEGTDYDRSLYLENEEAKIADTQFAGYLKTMKENIENFLTLRSEWLNANIPMNFSIVENMENQLYEIDSNYYDILGRKPEKNAKGIIIHNGEKHINF